MKLHTTARRSRVRRSAPSPTARLGNVDLTVTKDWRDGGGDGVGELQAALENTPGLTLAVKRRSPPSDDTEGQFKIY